MRRSNPQDPQDMNVGAIMSNSSNSNGSGAGGTASNRDSNSSNSNSRQHAQQIQQAQQAQQALDPRLMPSTAATTVAGAGPGVPNPASASATDTGPATMDSPDAHYHRQQHPVPYPIQHNAAGQQTVYSEARPGEVAPHAQPYFGMQQGRSSSDDIPDMLDTERCGNSGMGAFHNQSPNGDAQDQKRSRACEACRGLKVRCDMDPNAPNEPCKRCKKAGRNCTVTPPSRRRQKKADTRVAELERKIDALTAVIAQQNSSNVSYPPPHAAPEPYPMPGEQAPTSQSMVNSMNHADPRSSVVSGTAPAPPHSYHTHSDYKPLLETDAQRGNKRRRVDDPVPDSTTPTKTSHRRQESDVQHLKGWEAVRHELQIVFPNKVRTRIRDLLEPDMMRSIFHHYITKLCPTMPAVPFPPGTTSDQVFESKPVLLLAILAVGCYFLVDNELRQTLYDEVLAVLSESVLQRGIKSLEIVQAIQITSLWQKPPERPHSAQFYMLIHAAAVMSLDLGLGKRFNFARMKRGFGGPGSDLPPGPPQLIIDSDTIEARRAWMVSYFLCASISQVLRRPNLLRWNNYMNQCVNLLETSPDAAPSDRLLAQHIKIQHICEDINQSFALDDPEATSISILDPKVAYTLNVLENQLKNWEAQIPTDLRQPELLFFAQTTCLYLHEIALHVNHNTDDFRVPFTEASLKSGSEHGFASTLTQNQMISIESCLKASHVTIDTFCDFDLDMHIALPPLLYFVRVVYALVVLIKLHVAVVSPGSELGKIIKPSDVRAEEYLNKLWDVFQALVQLYPLGSHHKALHILGILRDWVGTHQHGDSSTAKPPSKDVDARGSQHAQPTSQYASGNNSNESLRVLSEAATAGANPQQPTANWSFDSPAAMSYAPSTMRSSNNGQHDGMSAASSTIMSTPNTYGGNDVYNMFGQQQQQLAKGNGMDYAAGMDFEQAVNIALQDLDFSGDLFGSFFGNGADAFQIPSDGMGGIAGGGGSGGGNGNNNSGGGGGGGGGQGGRWQV